MRQPPTTLSPGCHIRKPDVEGTSPPPHGPGVARPVIRRGITWPRAISIPAGAYAYPFRQLRRCAIAPRRSCEAFGGPWTPESFNPCVEHGRRSRRPAPALLPLDAFSRPPEPIGYAPRRLSVVIQSQPRSHDQPRLSERLTYSAGSSSKAMAQRSEQKRYSTPRCSRRAAARPGSIAMRHTGSIGRSVRVCRVSTSS
jgi:hypothetical protein